MNIMKNNYYIKNYTHDELLAKGFRFRKSTAADEADIYTYRFAVYKYRNKMNVLDCTITVNADNGNVSVLVTQQDGTVYHPFYDENCYGDFSGILSIINKNIFKVFKTLEILERE